MEMETKLLNEPPAKQTVYGTVNTAFDEVGGRNDDDFISESELSTTSPSPDINSAATSVSDTPMLFHRPLSSDYSSRLDRLKITGITPYSWNDIMASNDPEVVKTGLKCLRELPIPIKEKNIRASHLRWKLKLHSQSRCTECFTRLWKFIKTVYAVEWFVCLDPYIKHIEGFFGAGVGAYFSLLKFFLWLNVQLVFITVLFVVLPQLFFNYGSFYNSALTGWDAFKWSVFFYGFYQNVIHAELFPIAHMYFVTTCKSFVSAFATVVRGITKTYRRRTQNVVTGTCAYSEFIFSSWDYNIFRKDAVAYHHVTISRHLTRMVDEEYGYTKCTNKSNLYLTRVITNIVYLCLLVLGCFIINRCAFGASYRGGPLLQDFVFVETNQLALVFAVIKNLIPWPIRILSYIEKWKKPTGDYACIIRSVLYTSLLLVVLDFSMVSYFRNADLTNLNGTTYCWETEIGMHYFRIFGFDLIIGFAIIFFIDLVWAIIVGCGYMSKIFGYHEFDVLWGVSDLIFTQTLMWTAVYFSPLLPILGLVKFFILFGFRYSSANLTNAPPSDIVSPPRSGRTIYLLMVLASLLMILFPRAFVLLSVKPSSNCGPFMMTQHTYDVFTGRIVEGMPYAVDYVFNYLLSAQTTVPLVIIFILLIIFYRTLARTYKKILHRLNGELTMASRRGHTSSGINSGYPVDLNKGRLGDFP